MLTVTEAIAVNDLWYWLAAKPRAGGSLVSDFEAQDAMALLATSANKKLMAGVRANDVTAAWQEAVRPILAARSHKTVRRRKKPKPRP